MSLCTATLLCRRQPYQPPEWTSAYAGVTASYRGAAAEAVIPAKAGIQGLASHPPEWTPAYAE